MKPEFTGFDRPKVTSALLLEGVRWGEPMDEEGARTLVEIHEELLPYSLEVEETYRKLREGTE